MVIKSFTLSIINIVLNSEDLRTLSEQSMDYKIESGGARGVMVIVVGNGHGDTSPGQDWLHFS